jgi:hypothetical protein
MRVRGRACLLEAEREMRQRADCIVSQDEILLGLR